MKTLMCLFLILFSFQLQAALSDRLQIEEGIRNRLQDFLMVYDNQAKVTVRFDYRVYSESLPGTHLDSKDGTLPTKIESSDIRKVNIEIFSSQIDQIPDDIKNTLLQMIPVQKNVISIHLKKVKPTHQFNFNNQVQIQNLDQISSEWINTFSQVFYLTFAVVALFAAALFTILFLKRDKVIRDQVAQITKAISESAGSASDHFGYEEKHFNTDFPSNSTSTSAESTSDVQKLPMVALQELFSDCYWSGKDSNAHWLWSLISPDIKSKLLQDLPFMKEYSSYFTTQKTDSFNEYLNPFYLQPVSCKHLSMNDVQTYVKKDLSRWHQLSPLRQSALKLDLSEKIKAISSPMRLAFQWENIAASLPRKLTQVVVPLQLSEDDELLIFNKNQVVPEKLRESMISLVWLSLLNSEIRTRALEKFDARSLAEAWVAAPEILKTLESCLPEKKLKALNSYMGRVSPNKKSSTYLSLVQVGIQLYNQDPSEPHIKNEAA